MKIYIVNEDVRFNFLKEWLSKKYTITDKIDEANCVILGFKDDVIPKKLNRAVKVISYKDIQHVNCHVLSHSEYFLRKNAYLTAIGCISKLNLSHKNVVIYGNGRIGTYLNEMIENSVVLARHPKNKEKEIHSLDYTKADIIINTIPASIPIDIHLLKNNVKIIDLASSPYGFNHQDLKDKGIDIELWSALPAKTFPKESAWLIYEEVMSCLED